MWVSLALEFDVIISMHFSVHVWYSIHVLEVGIWLLMGQLFAFENLFSTWLDVIIYIDILRVVLGLQCELIIILGVIYEKYMVSFVVLCESVLGMGRVAYVCALQMFSFVFHVTDVSLLMLLSTVNGSKAFPKGGRYGISFLDLLCTVYMMHFVDSDFFWLLCNRGGHSKI